MKHIPEMVMMIGLPFSGKTKFAVKKWADSHLILSSGSLNTNARFDTLYGAALATQTMIVVDKTNGRAEGRADLIKKARGFGYRCHGYFFEATALELLMDEEKRSKEIPHFKSILLGAEKQMERPTASEFDEFFVVIP